MKKIISLFKRNYDGDRLVRDEVVPGAEWVLAGEGVATRKFDGSCCMVRNGKLFKRYDLKEGRTPPVDFEPTQERDEITGHLPGWVPVKEGPEDKWFREALKHSSLPLEDGTYEAIGTHFQGNPEGEPEDVLMRHGSWVLPTIPRTFNAIREYLSSGEIEGIVWHHPDGRMVKIKGKDFGIRRKKH